MDKMALTFQRGVGIVEAKMEKSGSMVTAKLVGASAKPTAGTAAAPGPGPARVPAADKSPVAHSAASGDQSKGISCGHSDVAESTRGCFGESDSRWFSDCHGGYQCIGQDPAVPVRVRADLRFRNSDAVSGKEVWKWSSGNVFTQVVRSDSIRPEGKWQFEVTWNRKDNDDRPVPAGQYRLTGIVTSLPAVRSAPVLLDLR